jgi:alpha-L-fucosidase
MNVEISMINVKKTFVTINLGNYKHTCFLSIFGFHHQLINPAMKRASLLFLIVFAFLVLLLPLSLAQKQTNERAQWFTDARYGMFIHWGLYSGAEGVWKGEKLRYDNDYAEWIMYRNRIEKGEYIELIKRFDWGDIDPEQWVVLAKQAGMKYVTLTAKHHDGFALWDSQVGEFNIGVQTEHQRDIVKELAEACRKHGLKMGLYYSHWVDWEHPYGWDHTKEIYEISNEQYDVYWQEKVIPQMRELLTNYGDIGLIWFDMWIHHSRTIVSREQLLQLKGLIRELQPNCLVNSRLGLSVEEDSDVDFQTLGDNQLGTMKQDFPWQSPATVAHSWGYHALEDQWKSTTTLLQSIINNVSLNGNLMLNIGPRANGEVPYEIEQRLLAIGDWLAINGESIHGSGAFDLSKDQHDWGRITCKQMEDGSTNVYLHVYNWPLNKRLSLTGVREAPRKIYALADKQKLALPFQHNQVVTSIRLPHQQPDPYVSVIVLEYDNWPEVTTELVAMNQYGGYSLTPRNYQRADGNTIITKSQRFGSVPEHVDIVDKSEFEWKVFVNQPMTLKADVSYSFQGEEGEGRIHLEAAGAILKQDVESTGMVVGEPRQEWHITSFNAQQMGYIHFPNAGYYIIKLTLHPEEEPMHFQWLWLGQ